MRVDDLVEVSTIDLIEMKMVGVQMSLPPSSPDEFKQLSERLDALRHRIDCKIGISFRFTTQRIYTNILPDKTKKPLPIGNESSTKIRI